MEWISILKCPFSGEDLRALRDDEIEAINKKIDSDKLWHADGTPMTKSIKSGLVTTNGNFIYPIIKGIVLLLKDLALIDCPEKLSRYRINADKQMVRNFYDQRGWVTNESGHYEDAVIYEDLREVSRDYLKRCHDRVNRYLHPSGTYMLDAASGALQFPEYLQYSANYKYRVCVDFSFQALSEAKKKLKKKGLYILCDMTSLPFKDNTMDGFVSLNTIYHIPKEEQVTAVNELYRTLLPGGKGIIVYDWFKHSVWMNFWLLPMRGCVWIRNRVVDYLARIIGTKGVDRRLYFYAHTPRYFRENLPHFQLKVWRSVSVSFMRYYIHSWLWGKQILNWLYKKEEQEPELCGLRGEYPLLVFEKPV